MKLLVKSSFTILFLLFFINISFAQKQNKAPYNALIYLTGKIKVHGYITAINDTALVIVDKREVTQSISYQRINRIKVFKRHKDLGYAITTGALVAGSIVASQSIDDGATAMMVGFGGTALVAGLSIALHNVIHGAEIKIDANKDKIDYQNMSQKLSKYLVSGLTPKS